ncbi:MAG: DUF2281 domain-containing protein [Planctomycetes bacterium]|nr:DUF2281 domain-containing protein [Planctomycetota bacterium]
MNKRKELWEELERLPDGALDELLEFVRAVKRKSDDDRNGCARATEPALARDWLKAEEDAAWSDL